MKRVIIGVLLVCILFLSIPVTAYSAETTQEIIHLENDSYLIVTTTVYSTRAAGTVSGDKNYTYYFGGIPVWEAVLSGSFSYTGSSATCTSASCDVSIYDSSWYTISKSTTRSGSSAKASVTVGRKVSGGTVDKASVNLKLTCSADGELS